MEERGPRWAAVVLAGGRARRLGGLDKPALTVGGRTLLDGVLAACRGADPVVVVGPRRPVANPVTWAHELPAYGGPLAALAAGLTAVPAAAELTAVLAADLPGLRGHTIDRLRAAAVNPVDLGHDGAVLVDEDSRRQWLCGVWRTAALRAALAAAGDPANRSVRGVLGGLVVAAVPAEPGEAADIDTPADLRAVRPD